MPPPDAAFLERAWSAVAAAAGRANVAVVLGTERIVGRRLVITALVINRDGTIAGFQDKVQLDPSEEATYAAGVGRRISSSPARSRSASSSATRAGAIRRPCAGRRAAARRWCSIRSSTRPKPGSYRPTTFADPANTFHEKAALCRAAENTCYFATVNFASEGSPTTSAVVRPDGTLLGYQPYGQPGLFIADLDLSTATGLLASRCKDC